MGQLSLGKTQAGKEKAFLYTCARAGGRDSCKVAEVNYVTVLKEVL